jgi:hypothetical protein
MADEPRDDADTLVTPPRSGPSGLYGGGGASEGMGGTVKLIVAGLVVGFGIKWAMDHFSGKKDGAASDHNASGKYLAIPGTTVVMGDGSTHTGAARYLNADVAVSALRNLLALYDYTESTQKPLVGDHFARITHIPEGGAPPAVGKRAFDWVAHASKMGFFVVMPATSTSGPWSVAEGNNVMIAVKPEDMAHSDILDEWAVVVEPHMLLPDDTSTASLDAYLTSESPKA